MGTTDTAGWSYETLKRLVAGEPLPLMVVDLDVLDENISRLAAVAWRAGKRLRVASKSVRVVALLRRILERGGEAVQGLMCFSPAEAALLAGEGFDDLLLAYPRVGDADLQILWRLRQQGVQVCLMIDSVAHVQRLEKWWGARAGPGGRGVRLPVCLDLDMSYRPLGGRGPHLGVQRSPLRRVEDLRPVLEALRRTAHLQLDGLMGYEAQVAGLGEVNPFTPLLNPVKRALKALSVRDVARRREAALAEVERAGLTVRFFNGGGTGSLRTTTRERCLTEVTAGSGFLQSHLFDYYPGNENRPACCFALPVTRRPQPDVVTCQSGGFIASGEIGPDKAPVTFLPAGLTPIRAEGFGEVQTPLRVPGGVRLELGDPVFFRPAKAGEIAERFNEYLLRQGEAIVGRAPTYRGLGHCFY